jgi:hypothetical protein
MAADGHRGAGTGTAGAGFANPALPDPQAQLLARHHFHKTHIGAPSEARVVLNPGAEAGHGGLINGIDPQDDVGVAHRHGGEPERAAVELDRLPVERAHRANLVAYDKRFEEGPHERAGVDCVVPVDFLQRAERFNDRAIAVALREYAMLSTKGGSHRMARV